MPSGAPRLLIAGETFEDLIFAELPRLPRPGEEIRTDQFRRTFGGGALISAAWARAEGLEVDLLSALPPRVGRVLETEGHRLPQSPPAARAARGHGLSVVRAGTQLRDVQRDEPGTRAAHLRRPPAGGIHLSLRRRADGDAAPRLPGVVGTPDGHAAGGRDGRDLLGFRVRRGPAPARTASPNSSNSPPGCS